MGAVRSSQHEPTNDVSSRHVTVCHRPGTARTDPSARYITRVTALSVGDPIKAPAEVRPYDDKDKGDW